MNPNPALRSLRISQPITMRSLAALSKSREIESPIAHADRRGQRRASPRPMALICHIMPPSPQPRSCVSPTRRTLALLRPPRRNAPAPLLQPRRTRAAERVEGEAAFRSRGHDGATEEAQELLRGVAAMKFSLMGTAGMRQTEETWEVGSGLFMRL
jgi:hypothetical protein